MTRPGYYVEGIYFANRRHQAIARARYMSRTQGGRMVEVREYDEAGNYVLAVSVSERSEAA